MSKVFTNYVGLSMDARVVYTMERVRTSSACFNKILYGLVGCFNLFRLAPLQINVMSREKVQSVLILTVIYRSSKITKTSKMKNCLLIPQTSQSKKAIEA